jgi:uncharacterized protein
MDITPLIPQGKITITGYGAGGFKINNQRVEGSLLVFPDRVLPWDGQVTLPSLEPVLGGDPAIELLLIGTGKSMGPVSPDIRHYFKSKHIALDVMDTGAACRTYDVLMGEGRRVAAALVSI